MYYNIILCPFQSCDDSYRYVQQQQSDSNLSAGSHHSSGGSEEYNSYMQQVIRNIVSTRVFWNYLPALMPSYPLAFVKWRASIQVFLVAFWGFGTCKVSTVMSSYIYLHIFNSFKQILQSFWSVEDIFKIVCQCRLMQCCIKSFSAFGNMITGVLASQDLSWFIMFSKFTKKSVNEINYL